MRALFILLLMLIAPCYATNYAYLYEADVVTTNMTPSDKDLKQAFQMVINRLTPGPNDLDNPITQAANPRKLLDSAHSHTSGKDQVLRIRFQPTAINQLMEEAGQQPWIKSRPKLFTVVMLSNGRYKVLVNKKKQPDIYAAIEKYAAEKGLELVYPDLNIMYKIQTTMLSSSERSIYSLAKATERLSLKPEALLYIELHSSEDTEDFWENAQVYYNKHEGYIADRLRTKPERVGRFSIRLASSFIFKHEEERILKKQSVYVNISNIQTAKAYHLVQNYLEHIPGVIRASVNSVTADAVLYTLDVSISPILLDKRLAIKYTPLPGNPDEGIMHYSFKT